jgi:tetratricopeptide (TPR) repeat protein
MFQSTRAMGEALLGPRHVTVNAALLGEGLSLSALGKHQEALRVLEDCRQRTDPANAPSLARVLDAMAAARIALGDPRRALGLREQALRLNEKGYGQKHWRAADSWVGIGEARLRLREAAKARVAGERAVAILTSGNATPEKLGDARFLLARALSAGREVPRALEVARAALADFERAKREDRQEAVRRWLAERTR